MNDDERALYIGSELLKRGFRAWFKYMFYYVEGRKFTEEAMHKYLFDCFQDMYDVKTTRQCIHIPPRAGKTTMSVYFVAYALTRNPRSNFIYTSFSQSLLKANAGHLQKILEHPVYKAMYLTCNNIFDNIDVAPVNDFWASLQDGKKKKGAQVFYSSTIVSNIAGGCVLFNSIGSAITGFGVGLRGGGGFDGALIIDDGDKTQNINSVVLREKVHDYFENTLLSRLNKSTAPILNIQQRLHPEDLGGFLAQKYQFNVLSVSLVDECGVCLLPSQYTPERLAELQQNNYTFQTQYQQKTMLLEGTLINIKDIVEIPRETWEMLPFKYTYISIDCASVETPKADYSAMLVFRIANDNIYLEEVVREKMDYTALYRTTEMLMQKYKPQAVLVEHASNGIALQQSLSAVYSNIQAIKPRGSKYERLQNASLPIKNRRFNIKAGDFKNKGEFMSELVNFTGDKTKHDDMVDALSQFINWWVERKQNTVSTDIRFI